MKIDKTNLQIMLENDLVVLPTCFGGYKCGFHTLENGLFKGFHPIGFGSTKIKAVKKAIKHIKKHGSGF